LILLATLALAPVAAAGEAPSPPVGDTESLLQPHDPGYADAQEFRTFLESHRIGVRRVMRSKDSNFLGQQAAAAFQTEFGPVSVVFFPKPDGAEHVTTELTMSRGMYRYTFRWREKGLVERRASDAPFHFLIHGRWFMFVFDPRTEEPLRMALTDGSCPDATRR
jgi:hypothetical protein